MLHPALRRVSRFHLSRLLPRVVRVFAAGLIWEIGVTTDARAQAVSSREIAAEARPAVVRVSALDSQGKIESHGSGFFVSADGVLVTNFHVIEGAASLEVELSSGEKFDNIYLLNTDQRRDLAILKVPVEGAPFLRFGSDATLEVGDPIFTVGNPLGLDRTFSTGVVSGKRIADGTAYIQISAPISSGSSGGPVLNKSGLVVGVVTLSFEEAQNLNFAVASRYIRPLIATAGTPTRFSGQPTGVRGATRTATSRNEIRAVADPAGVFVLEGAQVNGRAAIVPVGTSYMMAAWWRGPATTASPQFVWSNITVLGNGRVAGEIGKPMEGGFVSEERIVLAPAAVGLTKALPSDLVTLTRLPRDAPLSSVDGMYAVQGTGGDPDLGHNTTWSGLVAVISGFQASIAGVDTIIVVATITSREQETFYYALSALRQGDGSVIASPFRLDNGNTVTTRATIRAGQIELYNHYDRSWKYDYETRLRGTKISR